MPCQSAQTTEVVSFANGQRQGIPKQGAQQTPAAEIQTWDTSARVGDIYIYSILADDAPSIFHLF